MIEKPVEFWVRHPEFDFIEGSSFGRVRTIDRYIKQGNAERFVIGRFLKQQRDKDGYLGVYFRVNGKGVHEQVHRLIIECFVPNPNGLPQVNHKDCNRANNNVDNIEWCDASYNRRYTEKYGVSATEAFGHRLYAVNLKTLKIIRFQSQGEASRMLGVSQGNICSVIKGNRKQTGGYWFTYADHNAVDNTRLKFGNYVASKVEHLVNENN